MSRLAQVVPVESGSRTLKDAINEAMRDWVTNVVDTHYLIGSAIGPHPFPTIVRDFQSVIGKEARSQVRKGSRAGQRMSIGNYFEVLKRARSGIQDPCRRLRLCSLPTRAARERVALLLFSVSLARPFVSPRSSPEV